MYIVLKCYFCNERLTTLFPKEVQELYTKYSIVERIQKYCQKYLFREGRLSTKQRDTIHLLDTLGLNKKEREHFCWSYRYEYNYKPMALEECYPLSVNFVELKNHVEYLKEQLDGIITGTEDSFIKDKLSDLFKNLEDKKLKAWSKCCTKQATSQYV